MQKVIFATANKNTWKVRRMFFMGKNGANKLGFKTGIAANYSGMEGELFVKRVLPELVQISRPGADFMTRDGRHFIEVKATFSHSHAEESIILKSLNKRWMNEIADTVLIVTRTHVFYCPAEKLRKFVEEKHSRLKKLNKTRQDHRERILVPLRMMQSAGISECVARKNISRKNFNLQTILGKKEALPKPKRTRTLQQIIEAQKERSRFMAGRHEPNNGSLPRQVQSRRMLFQRKTIPR